MRLPSKDSATAKALRTVVQAMVGLFIAVWTVPGVPHAVFSYIVANMPVVLLAVGIPSGIVTFVWYFVKKEVPNY